MIYLHYCQIKQITMTEYKSTYDPSEFEPPALPEQRGRFERLRDAAQSPEFRARVAEIVRPYGEAAIHGVMIESGVAKIDKKSGRVKIKPFGAVKAVLRPTHTARKALQGAVSETRSALRADAISGGRRAFGGLVNGLAQTEFNYATPPSIKDDLSWADSDFGRSRPSESTGFSLPLLPSSEDLLPPPRIPRRVNTDFDTPPPSSIRFAA